MASTFPAWVFDESEIPDPLGYGERAVEFLRRLKHPLSTEPGFRFQLPRWLERIVRRIYGPRDEDGERIVREVFLFLPRGNRKTSIAAALALLHLLGPERVPGGQIIFAASDREQAGIGFREAAGIVEMDKRLGFATRIYEPHAGIRTIKSKLDGSTLRAVSSDGRAQHGTTPTFVLADEIHSWQRRDLWEALQSGMAKRRGGLTIVATTAGRGNEGLAAERYNYARRVALGEIENPAFLPIMFEIAADEDWQDEAIWHRCNPGLAYGFHDIKKFRSDAEEARANPSKAFEFQQFKLNRWFGNSRDPLFDMRTYDAGIDPDFDLAGLERLPCFLGVDMSVNGDLTAIVGAWRHDDGRISIHPWFFVPGDDLRIRADVDGVPYERWRDEGLINAVAGAIIRPEAIEAHIRELYERFAVEEIAFDPHLAATIMQRLFEDGLPVVGMRQGPLTMAPAIGALERTVNGRLLHHSGHPILRHHFDSVVASRNDTGLVRMHKGKRTDRIDGAVAAAMAVGRASQGEKPKSIFESDDFDPSSVVLSF
ncbi:Terminase [Ancylobacter novellus DSM 506]|uniref:Terminase n=1 Tax=Ancylobacter novellus (strain ATCC 8093 / DSM 506 / JCM 20403 / CCM 1077 / IAM 12100 / NBRC 12443 / NCIMB 10456) TaxID=639283 RepID=D7A0A7_ANCN5|nr:terminase TerL endonuclease subunit [Ancylobacter novellus]ADH89368.1 Terminase [Ancylobacter novellus DSM 506]